MKQHKNIDGYFKERIEEDFVPAEMPSFEDAMALLEETNKQKGRRLPVGLWWFGGILLLATACGFSYLLNDSDSSQTLASKSEFNHNTTPKVAKSNVMATNGSQQYSTLAPTDIEFESNASKNVAISKTMQPYSLQNQNSTEYNTANTTTLNNIISHSNKTDQFNTALASQNRLNASENRVGGTAETLTPISPSFHSLDGESPMTEIGLDMGDLSLLATKAEFEENPFVLGPVKPVDMPTQKSKSLNWSWAAYAGFSLLDGKGSAIDIAQDAYINRRNTEESNIPSLTIGLRGNMALHNWRFTLGVDYAQMQKKARYSDLFYNITTIPRTERQYSLVDVYDSNTGAFIGQQRIFRDVIVQVQDTQLVSLDQRFLTQTQSVSYMDLPFTLGYALCGRRFEAVAFVGLAPGMMVSQSGKMLDAGQTGLREMSQVSQYAPFRLRGLGGLRLKYRIGGKTSLFLEGNFQYQFTNQYKAESSLRQRGMGYGVLVGLEMGLK